ncbi:polysaccharide biosynthesis tyrosine autokinase [Parafrankia elaeagni]|uniref:polysaccharide biosynthesis tyrosine autokinase n=1 Tax=Parafrankia elaeagni TaxID=222534 RepID=UPI000381F3AB|nr:polysaccharide biosynthesis tyrosine autokinase [Parafrankia elaeagni]
MELRDYVRVLRRSWLLVLTCALLGGLLAATASWRQTKIYAASVTMLVSASDAEAAGAASAYQGGLLSQQRVKSYASLIASERVAAAVIDQLRLDESPTVLRSRIEAQAVPDTVLLRAVVRDSDPRRAQEIADGIGEVFSDAVDQIEQPAEDEPPSVRVRVWENAKLPTEPISPQPVRNIALGVLLGLLMSIAAAFVRYRLDTSVGGDADANSVTGLATIGMIAYDSDAGRRPLIVHLSPHSRRAEAFRQLRTNLQFVDVDGGPGSILVTSAVSEEGKTTTVCNLAITLAQGGARVCLVEGDLRRPSFGDYLGIESAAGLTSVLIGAAALDDVLQHWGEGRVGDGRIEILPSGPVPPNPSELLGSRHMAELLQVLDSRFDIVLVDAPPLLPVTDAAVLATRVDGVLLVARSGRTRREQLRRAAENLRAVDANLLGTVLTMMPTRGANAHYYGRYGTYAPHPRHTRSERGGSAQPAAGDRGLRPVADRSAAGSGPGKGKSGGTRTATAGTPAGARDSSPPDSGALVTTRPVATAATGPAAGSGAGTASGGGSTSDERAASKPTAASRKAATRGAAEAGGAGSASSAGRAGSAGGKDPERTGDLPVIAIASQRQPDDPTAPLSYGGTDHPDRSVGR